MKDPIVRFRELFARAQREEHGDATAMTLATVGVEGRPTARMVLLKGADANGFVFFTNYASRKARELAARRAACLVFLWSELERQVRIEGEVDKVPAPDSDRYFASRPLGARVSAWASSQSDRVASREHLEKAAAETRARFGDAPPRPPHWGGYRLMPRAIEFWQGRADRLHDRLRYGKNTAGWTVERLAP
jgi:pyridoxamine 5'-phosphate oxidase